MLKYSRLPNRYDPELLREDILPFLGQDWISHYQPKDFDGQWDILPLRSIGGNEKNAYSIPSSDRPELAYADTPLLAECPSLRSLLENLQCEKTAVRLMRLRAGSEIKEHSDIALSIEDGEARLHIPIITDPMVEFYLDHERLSLEEGDCWYLNLSLKHSVINRSTIDRVHLVIDCKTNAWLLDLFNSREAIASSASHDPKRSASHQAIPSTPNPNVSQEPKQTETVEKAVDIIVDVSTREKILSFIRSIGIEVEFSDLPQQTVLPGISIEGGTLKVDPKKLLYPGDLLHEAGHVAVVPSEERSTLRPESIGKRKDQAAEEMMAIAWSYAAAIYLGIDPYVVFHEHGYHGGGRSIADNFKQGRTIGVPMLQYRGLAAREVSDLHPGYPDMVRWTCL